MNTTPKIQLSQKEIELLRAIALISDVMQNKNQKKKEKN
jgi:hypothetical protein